MKIQNDLQNLPPVSGVTQAPGARSGVDGAASQPAGTGQEAIDQANLSIAAQAASQALSLPDVRQEKVSAIQAAMTDGSYHVLSSQVATSLMRYMAPEQQNS